MKKYLQQKAKQISYLSVFLAGLGLGVGSLYVGVGLLVLAFVLDLVGSLMASHD